MRSSSSRRLTVVFLAVFVPAAAMLVWLGLRLLEQDRLLFAQRDIERHEAGADAVVRALLQTLAAAEQSLDTGRDVPGTVRIEAVAKGMRVAPGNAVAWIARPVPGRPIPDETFREAEALEYQGHATAAAAIYDRLRRTSDARIRAGALLRAARVARRRHAYDVAVARYRELARIESVEQAGMPVSLLARRAICDLLLEGGNEGPLASNTADLEREFLAGRWALDRDNWELVHADLRRWGRPGTATPEQLAVSASTASLLDLQPRASSGRLVIGEDDMSVTLLWKRTPAGVAAIALPLPTVRNILEAAVAGGQGRLLAVALLDPEGRLIAGTQPQNPPAVRRAAVETSLPWTVVAARGPGWGAPAEFESRRRIFAAGLAAIGLLLAGGAYVLWRLIQRELAVARLQTEFVSAVSHEFRTPVTSLRHVIELLQEDDDLTRDRRASFYDVLSRSTERLHRLVESLLDFARMEGGRRPYDLQPVLVADFVRATTADFARDQAARGSEIRVEVTDGIPPRIDADAAALGHALWNLLDNAVKYSPEAREIAVKVAPHPAGIAIAVSDRGIGVPPGERSDIFLKFVRGEKATRLGIKGTGVGLAMVMHIVRAHRGTVELESEEGKGSTFRIVLPAAA